ncbi:MAG: AI-2E family transporter [Bdellovibrionota bacterium]
MRSATTSRGLVIAASLTIIVWGLVSAKPILVPLSISALLSFSIAPLVEKLRRCRMPEWIALAISFTVFTLPFLTGLYFVFFQARTMASEFPLLLQSLQNQLSQFLNSNFARSLDVSTQFTTKTLLQWFSGGATQSLQIALASLAALLNASAQVLLVLVFTMVMVSGRRQIKQSFAAILGQFSSIDAVATMRQSSSLIQHFLLARMLIVVIITLLDGLVLGIFGLKYSLLMGAFLGLMTWIPAVGFILGLLPPVLLALATGRSPAEIALLSGILLLISAFEGNVLTPKFVGGRLKLNTLASFIGLFAGALGWGIWGMLLAIPLLGILRIVFSQVPVLQPWAGLLADTPGPRIEPASRLAPQEGTAQQAALTAKSA